MRKYFLSIGLLLLTILSYHPAKAQIFGADDVSDSLKLTEEHLDTIYTVIPAKDNPIMGGIRLSSILFGSLDLKFETPVEDHWYFDFGTGYMFPTKNLLGGVDFPNSYNNKVQGGFASIGFHYAFANFFYRPSLHQLWHMEFFYLGADFVGSFYNHQADISIPQNEYDNYRVRVDNSSRVMALAPKAALCFFNRSRSISVEIGYRHLMLLSEPDADLFVGHYPLPGLGWIKAGDKSGFDAFATIKMRIR